MQQQSVQPQKPSFLQVLRNPIAAFSKWKQDRHDLMPDRRPAAIHWRNEGSIWAEDVKLGFEDGRINGLMLSAVLFNMQSERPPAALLPELMHSSDGRAGLKAAKVEAKQAVFSRAYAAAEAHMQKIFEKETLARARINEDGPEGEAVGLHSTFIVENFEKGALKMLEVNYWQGFASAFARKG